ncbi:hypothetical protein CDD83_2936 [Cordyceps sp. RAO-2017]|nr:hypothetical protein CDD83_2936 [Cordyceps sp. RAO-2017]
MPCQLPPNAAVGGRVEQESHMLLAAFFHRPSCHACIEGASLGGDDAVGGLADDSSSATALLRRTDRWADLAAPSHAGRLHLAPALEERAQEQKEKDDPAWDQAKRHGEPMSLFTLSAASSGQKAEGKDQEGQV